MRKVLPSQWAISAEELKNTLESARLNTLGSETSSDLSQQRMLSLDYYMGDMTSTLPADEGRSAAVSTDVQDCVEGVLPILLDVLFGGSDVIQFKPRNAADVPMARQETDAVNHVFLQENQGFIVGHNAVKDALIQKNGFVKWWVEQGTDTARRQLKGLTQDAYVILMSDPDQKIVDGSIETYEEQQVDPTTGQPTTVTLYNCLVERSKKYKRFRIDAVPPEEILVSRFARHNVQEWDYWAHIQLKARADVKLLHPGHDKEIDEVPAHTVTTDNSEAQERSTVEDYQDGTNQTAYVNKGMQLIEVAEHYIRLPLEKDGIPRKYRFTTVGTKLTVIDVQEMGSWPLATGTPIIMPHRAFGRSLADLVMDVQEIKTSLIRAMNDNAYYANNQRIEISESHAGENTLDDLMNNRVGGLVRTKMPGGINPLPAQSIGNWVLGSIEYFDSVKENRTGVTKYNQGLDADSLNHTAHGISRIMDAAEMRIKLMARILAETLIADIFRGIHEMLAEHSEQSFDVQLRGEWVPINPMEWQERKHVTVDMPLGAIGKQQMIAFFAQILSVQKEAITNQGGNTPNGLTSYDKIFNTLDDMLRLAGLPSAVPYFNKPAPPDPNAPPPPDPAMVKAQGELKIKQAQAQQDGELADLQAKADLQLEHMKLIAAQQRERDEFMHKVALAKLQHEHDTQMELAKVEAKLKIEAFAARKKAELERQRAEEEMAINRQQADLDAELARKESAAKVANQGRSAEV